MASEEHKSLARYLKEVHSELRKKSSKIGARKAWKEHCQKKDVLEKYAIYMEKLATKHWETNANRESCAAISRIEWTAQQCHDYFQNKSFLTYREKENVIATKLDVVLNIEDTFSTKTKLIDVGSCYNPFKKYDFLDVFAVDLSPANEYVMQCDFLNVEIGHDFKIDDTVTQIKENHFEAVTFCFLLEYIPNSEMRVLACEKAYKILKKEGLLIISTPDSKHVGANSNIMKCWRYTLAIMGFMRIKYEKYPHMHCMLFRKAIEKDTAVRWAILHKQPYMDYKIHIPQDQDAAEKVEDQIMNS